MILPALTLFIFLVVLGLLVCTAYFFVEVPVARQKLRARLAAVQQVGYQEIPEGNNEILRSQILSRIPQFNRLLLQIRAIPRIQLFLSQAAVKMQVVSFLLLMVSLALLGGVIGLVMNFPLILVLPLMGGLAICPPLIVGYKRKRRLAKFQDIFPDAIDLLARAVRAGHAFTTAFSLIGEEMADPLAEEFRITFRQQSLGMPLREALGNLVIRIPSPDVRIFVSALQIQRDSGGNLGEILDNLSFVIRERFKILRQVDIHTAEGRLSMYMLMAMPLGAGLMMYLANPEYLKPLWTDPMGQQFLGACALSQIVGYFVIKKIIRIKV